jgi:hypothetical protein
MVSVVALGFAGACTDPDTAPLESTPPPSPAAPVAAAGTVAAAGLAQNTWAQLADVPNQRSMPILAAVAKANGDTRLFAIGGNLFSTTPNGSPKFTPVGEVNEWHPGTNRWSRAANSPYVWQGRPPFAVVSGAKVYIPGGFLRCGNCAIPIERMAIYDAGANAWTTVALPQISTGAVAWALDGKVYWAGKCYDRETFESGDGLTLCTDTGARSRFLLRYNPANGNWVYLRPPPHDLDVAGVPGTLGGKLYLATRGPTDVYDPATNQWSTTAELPIPSAGYFLGGAAVAAKLLVAGSATEDGTTPSTFTRSFDPSSGGWSSRAAAPERFEALFGTNVRGVRVQVEGQPRLAIVGGFGHHWQYAP